MYWFE